MRNVAVSISMTEAGLWKAELNLLGRTATTQSPTLWDCLEACKQLVWDIAIAADGHADLHRQRVHADVAVDGKTKGTSATDLMTDIMAPDAPGADLMRIARHLVIDHQAASVSLIQRHLLLGYQVAQRVISALEAECTIGPADAEGNRSVLRPKPVLGGEDG